MKSTRFFSVEIDFKVNYQKSVFNSLYNDFNYCFNNHLEIVFEKIALLDFQYIDLDTFFDNNIYRVCFYYYIKNNKETGTIVQSMLNASYKYMLLINNINTNQILTPIDAKLVIGKFCSHIHPSKIQFITNENNFKKAI